MQRSRLTLLAVFATTLWATTLTAADKAKPAAAADNQLTSAEKEAGWQLLFNGKDHTGWICNNGKPVAAPIENGALVPYKSGGYVIMHEKQFGDFVLACDVKMPEKCNSGIFFRMAEPKDPVNSGYEAQILTGKGTGMHDFGAIYDLAPLTENASNGAGVWNHVEITCQGSKISVNVNGKDVCAIDTDDFDKPGVRPDGGKHKFKEKGAGKIIKNAARSGYLGFQDHGAKVWYKNVKLRELK